MFYHCGTSQQNGCDDNESQLRPHASMVVFMVMFMMVPVVFVAVTFVCVMVLTHTSKLIDLCVDAGVVGIDRNIEPSVHGCELFQREAVLVGR